MNHRGTVIVLAKAPVPGRVKTRLCPPLNEREAAAVAAACLEDTLAAVDATRCARRVVALDDPGRASVPDGFDVAAQPEGELDKRLTAAFAGAAGPTVLVGMDTPQVTPELLERALATVLGGADAVLGLAVDGGYWAVGFRRAHPLAFRGVPTSTAVTGAAQLARLHCLGIRPAMLPVLRDVDDYEDARIVAAEAPHSRFALQFTGLRGKYGVAATR